VGWAAHALIGVVVPDLGEPDFREACEQIEARASNPAERFAPEAARGLSIDPRLPRVP
jgi:hypothetical protein